LSDWNWIKSSSFARQYGKWLGLLHNHSQNYRPNPTESFLAQTNRVAWNQVHSNLLSRGSDVFVPKSNDNPDSLEVKSLKEYNDLMEWINALPKTQENYGLIHGDLNISNFFITEEEKQNNNENNENNSNDPLSVISIDAFDWDQLQYGWFSYDISVVLWGVMLMQLGLVPDCATLDVEWFKTEFLNGYTEVRKITEEELSYLPNFIRIRKLFYIMFCVKSLSDMKSQDLTTFESFEKFATTVVELCTK
jgi:Ser/Thr protein kinase RdoA (MazF antagonist)